jgi:hypothetical protein
MKDASKALFGAFWMKKLDFPVKMGVFRRFLFTDQYTGKTG